MPNRKILKEAAKQALEWVLEETNTLLTYYVIEKRENIMWRRRHRCGKRGRFPKPVTLGAVPAVNKFTPIPLRNIEPIFMEMAELEAFRLVDMDGLSQEEAGQRMSVSRGTIWRLVQSARKKTAQALTEGRPLQIVAGQSSDVK